MTDYTRQIVMAYLPNAVAVLGIVLIVLVAVVAAVLITRAVVIRHYFRHHIEDFQKEEMLELRKIIEELQAEKRGLVAENNQMNLQLKVVESAFKVRA